MLLGSAADSAPASASACSCASVDSLTLGWNYKEGQEGMQEDGLVLKRPSEMMQALCPNPVPPPSAAHLMGMNPRLKANLEMAPKCPRCDSSNTKFCYYNNYSLSQPRYFCKTCRRYWTKGGSLRNVPVGGGCRKNKRPKKAPPQHRPLCVNPNPNSNDPNCTTAPTTSTSTSTSNADCDEHQPNPAANFDQMNLSRPLPSMYFSLLNQNQNQQPTDALGALAFSGRSLQIQQPSPYFGMAMAADATMARGLAVDVLSSSSSTDLMPNISTMQSLEGSSPNNNMTVDDEFARRGRIRSCLAQAESPLTPQTATTAARTTPTTAHLNAIYDSVASSTTSTTTANMLHMGDEINDALPLPLSNYIAVNCDAQQQNQHQQQRHQVPINNQRMMSMMMNPLPLLHTLQQQHSQHGGHNSNNINLQHTDGNANDVQSECEKQHKFDSNLGFNSTHFLTNCNTQVPKPDDGESPCNWPVALPCFSTADTFNSNVPWPPEFPSCALPNFSNSVI